MYVKNYVFSDFSVKRDIVFSNFGVVKHFFCGVFKPILVRFEHETRCGRFHDKNGLIDTTNSLAHLVSC